MERRKFLQNIGATAVGFSFLHSAKSGVFYGEKGFESDQYMNRYFGEDQELMLHWSSPMLHTFRTFLVIWF